MLRFLTSGESHGRALVAILDGVPAGLAVDMDRLNGELARRQQGYGRGGRQKIEADVVDIVGGLRHGITSGAPLALLLSNADFENWKHVMSPVKVDETCQEVKEQLCRKAITRFRPGHADLAGTLKFRQADIRDVLERASARETAARVAAGAICQQLLKRLGISIAAHVVQVGKVTVTSKSEAISLEQLEEQVFFSEMYCRDAEATEKMKEAVKEAWQDGDSLGGVVEVLADGLPVGLGSYTQWDERLDGQLAQAVMSVQAIKAVEIGDGIAGAGSRGSQTHDALYPCDGSHAEAAGGRVFDVGTSAYGMPFLRKTNRAGGLEGGMTNGARLQLRAYMKPIPTLRKGLPSVSFPDFKAEFAHFERSDVCAVPAAAIVVKAMVSFVLCRALLNKFGGDSMADTAGAIEAYRLWCQAPDIVSPADVSSAHCCPGGSQEMESE